jgi:hypothetical protein
MPLLSRYLQGAFSDCSSGAGEHPSYNFDIGVDVAVRLIHERAEVVHQNLISFGHARQLSRGVFLVPAVPKYFDDDQ